MKSTQQVIQKVEQPSTQKTPPALRLLGQRVFIRLGLVPYMHLFSPLALGVITLKNPRGMIYTKKVFLYLKRQLLLRSFKNNYLKNQRKLKLLIAGCQYFQRQRFISEPTKQIKKHSRFLNKEQLRDWFRQIKKNDEKFNKHSHEPVNSFLQSISFTIQRRKKRDLKLCLNIEKVFNQIIERQKNGELSLCQKLFKEKILRFRIPWTQNLFDNVEQYGYQIWNEIGININLDQIKQTNCQQTDNIPLNKSKKKHDPRTSKKKISKKIETRSSIKKQFIKKENNEENRVKKEKQDSWEQLLKAEQDQSGQMKSIYEQESQGSK